MLNADRKKNWPITSEAFHSLLDWFDEGNDSEGRKYLEIRERLVSYFDRRNCSNPDDLADETLNRVARRLEEEGKIESETPAKYCYITARFVLLEYFRAKKGADVSLENILPSHAASASTDTEIEEKQSRERMLQCLENCMKSLENVNRRIITSYYFGAERVKIENRRALAKSLDVSVNALSIRACRIRSKLEVCVGKCVGPDQIA